MIGDSARFTAYAKAIAQCVRPGDVVAEIGCGPGIFSLLACRAGAQRVYAIETENIIDVARQIATANGLADRIHFFQSDSRKTELPERVNVIVSDIRGMLPLFDGAVTSLKDAKKRLLRLDGVMIPRRDVVKAAVIEAEKVYSNLIAPWTKPATDEELSVPLELVLNSAHGVTCKPEQQMSEPEELCRLDYMGDPNPSASARLSFQAKQSGMAHGICVWFETELYGDIGFSSGPGCGATIYGQLFLPWLEPLKITEGQKVFVTLNANLVGKDYIWRWETETTGHDGANIHFRQSTFEGSNVSSAILRQHATDYVPVLTEEGQADRFLLEAMDGSASLEEIARKAVERFPTVYPLCEDAFERAAELARKLSR